LIPVKDTEILAQKMELLINDANKRTEMGKNSRLLAEQEFSINKVIANHLAIYNSLSKQ
jgi:glycosyltransferase involved in cell wall biosynthesis